MFKDVKTILNYSAGKLKKYRGKLLLASFFKLVSFPLGISVIYITKTTIDKGILGKNLEVFLKFTALGLAVFMFIRVLWYLTDKLLLKIKTNFSKDVNYDLTRRLFGLDYLKIRELSAAENSFILDYDYNNMEKIIFNEIPSLVSVLKIPAFFILASMLSVQLTLLVLISVPFVALHTAWASRKKKKIRARELYFSRKHHSVLNDMLLNVKLVKSFFKENWALERISSLFKRKTESSLKSFLFFNKAHFVSDVFTKVNTVLFWLLGGYLIIKGRLTFGSFSAVSMYTALIISALGDLGGVVQEFNEERVSIARCATFIREISGKKEQSVRTGFEQEPWFGSDIELKNIVFGYKKDELLFNDISFSIQAGKWTLIRGASGVGKTTLLSLLMRLFPFDGGGAFLGASSIDQIDREVYSKNISVVHQEAYLFNDTLIANILLGEKKPPGFIEKILYCAKLDELVDSMTIGYNSRVGEFGSAISGGQKQRVAIARALAREPKILILDEATSFLDSKTEEAIYKNIKNFFPAITMIFVTHRDTARKFADEILVLENGKVLYEEGLSKKKSGYSSQERRERSASF